MSIVNSENIRCVHGKVRQPFTDYYYNHAWIEINGVVKDWQTMKMGSSKFANIGWPKDLFYETFNPIEVKEYSSKQLIKMVQKLGHAGPFRS